MIAFMYVFKKSYLMQQRFYYVLTVYHFHALLNEFDSLSQPFQQVMLVIGL